MLSLKHIAMTCLQTYPTSPPSPTPFAFDLQHLIPTFVVGIPQDGWDGQTDSMAGAGHVTALFFLRTQLTFYPQTWAFALRAPHTSASPLYFFPLFPSSSYVTHRLTPSLHA